MGNICELSNDLLMKILILTPTKDVVATSLLSKRWHNVWKLVPKLEYDDEYNTEATASQFIDNFLQMNNAPFLETLRLTLKRVYALEDYEKWVNVAVARNVRLVELIRNRSYLSPLPLPMSLYTHETLVVLRLKQSLIEEVPSTSYFRCLKTLSLKHVIFSSDETVERFLSCCPVLETLDVVLWICEKVKIFAICVPSLQRLKIESLVGGYQDAWVDHGFVINAPCLKYLEIIDHFSGFCSLFNMPEKVEAKIHLRHCDSEELLGSLTSAKKLALCLKPKMDSDLKCDFDQLVSLELCAMCSLDWLNLILRHSPTLRRLRFMILRDSSCRNSRNVRSKWEQPSCVPESLMLSLESVEWVWYKGTQEEECVLMYLLEHGSFLKTMSIVFSISTGLEEKSSMQTELRVHAQEFYQMSLFIHLVIKNEMSQFLVSFQFVSSPLKFPILFLLFCLKACSFNTTYWLLIES